MTDNMPDFDNMSPEEINNWLESLAKRQGATEGFTTAADQDIAEIDPTTVTIDEPGYIPYGQESSYPKREPAKAAPPPPAPEPQRPAAQVIPPPPVRQSPPEQPPPVRQAPPVTQRPATPPPVRQTPIAQPPPMRQAPPEQPPVRQQAPAASHQPTRSVTPPPPAPEPVRADESGLAWLESLAGGEEDNSLFNLDLSSLTLDEPVQTQEPVSSISWLEDLARTQDDPFAEETPTFGGGSDSVEWLESLARRQGGDTEEFITPAQLDIPMPDESEIEAPGYVAFSFDSPPVTNRAPAPPLHDPSDFLSSFADDEPAQPAASEEMSIDAIQRAISAGTVTREQMQVFLEYQNDVLASEPEISLPPLDDDEEALAPADLPDWLLEQVGAPPSQPQSASSANNMPSLDSLFPPTPASDDMPDWLKENFEERENEVDFGGLFGEEEEPEAIAPAASLEMDPHDTWAEAFDLEHEGGIVDVDTVPDWYERNVKDPARIAAVEQLAHRDDELVETALPEEDLPLGEAQGIPAWLGGAEMEYEEAPAEPAFADWLSELENPEAVEVPDWLSETMLEEPPVEVFEPTPEPPRPVIQQVAAPPPIPVAPPVVIAPPPRPAVSSGALERARDREQNGDLEGSLVEYEGLIRANIELDAVVVDLTQLVKSYRTVPSVYRVLGDGLMRQGKLQQALNTYREALNQL